MTKRERFQFYQDKAGLWRWRLVAGNGRIIADSGEGYARRHDVIRAAAKIARVFRGHTAVTGDDGAIVVLA